MIHHSNIQCDECGERHSPGHPIECRDILQAQRDDARDDLAISKRFAVARVQELAEHRAARDELERDVSRKVTEVQNELANVEAERDRLRAKCEKIIAWLARLADRATKRAAQNDRFPSLKEANEADAANYLATAADIRTALEPKP